jgi:hypothetical protein
MVFLRVLAHGMVACHVPALSHACLPMPGCLAQPVCLACVVTA